MAARDRLSVTGPSGAEEVAALYTRRKHSYVRYVQAFGHRQGLQAVLEALPPPGADGKVLDAGCGSGLSILALHDAVQRQGIGTPLIQAFDLTSAMLERCRTNLQVRRVEGVELRHANVGHLDSQLPASWAGYDLIVCASMLEYLPPAALAEALANLGRRLVPTGQLLAIVTRSSFWPTRWIWQCTGYRRQQLTTAFTIAGYRTIRFCRYPLSHAWLNIGSHVVVAGHHQR